MAIIKLNYDKEEFNKLMNSLYNVYNFVKDRHHGVMQTEKNYFL